MIFAEHPDRDALDLNPLGGVPQRSHPRVRRLEPDRPVRLAVERLERRALAVDQSDDPFAILRRLAALDDQVVTILDVLVDHGVSADLEDERLAPPQEVLGDRDRRIVNDRLEGFSSRNAAQERQLDGVGQSGPRQFERAAPIGIPPQHAFGLQVAEMLMDGGHRGEAEGAGDLLEAGSISMVCQE